MRKTASFLALAALVSSGSAMAATPEWKISESSGTVNVLRAGVSKIAISGSHLKAGDVIATGEKSRAVLIRGQEYVVVSPNSRLRISAPKKEGGVFQFFEELGNVLFRIDKKATPHFGVKTPYLAAVVKGTTFSVTVSESGTAVQVTEGAVQVSTLDGGASQLLSPGMIGMVNGDQQYRLSITGSETRTIDSPNAPAAPAVEEPVAVAVADSDFEGVISAPVPETPVSLSDLTGGLVSNASTAAAPQLAINDGTMPDLLGNGTSLSNNNPGTFGNGNALSGQELASNDIPPPLGDLVTGAGSNAGSGAASNLGAGNSGSNAATSGNNGGTTGESGNTGNGTGGNAGAGAGTTTGPATGNSGAATNPSGGNPSAPAAGGSSGNAPPNTGQATAGNGGGSGGNANPGNGQGNNGNGNGNGGGSGTGSNGNGNASNAATGNNAGGNTGAANANANAGTDASGNTGSVNANVNAGNAGLGASGNLNVGNIVLGGGSADTGGTGNAGGNGQGNNGNGNGNGGGSGAGSNGNGNASNAATGNNAGGNGQGNNGNGNGNGGGSGAGSNGNGNASNAATGNNGGGNGSANNGQNGGFLKKLITAAIAWGQENLGQYGNGQGNNGNGGGNNGNGKGKK